MSTVLMLPPSNGARNFVLVNPARSYSSTPGISIPVQSFDVPILQSNGWSLQTGGASLQMLTISASSFPVGEPQGTLIANIVGTTSGSMLSISNVSPSGAVQITQVSGMWQLQVGTNPPSVPTAITFSLTEMLSNTTTLSVSETSSGSSSYQLTFPQNSYVSLSSAANTALAWDRMQPWSCMAGINLSSPPGISGAIGGLIFTNAGTSPFPCYEFWISASTQTNPGCLVVRLINNYTNNQIYVVGSIYVCDGYYHAVGCSYDGSSSASGVKMYVDGIQDTSLAIVDNNLTGPIVGTTNPFYIGNQSGTTTTYALVGALNFFALSNVVRGTSYFSTYPWAGAPPAVDGSSVLYFNFSEGGGATLHDQSSNGFNGTLSGTTLPTWSAGPPATAPAPTNSLVPSLSGTAQQGQVLTASKGTWANAIQFTYQWYWGDTGAPISSATSPSYVAQSSDIGHTLLVKVTGTGAGGSTTVASSATSPVIASSVIISLESSQENQSLSSSSTSVTVSTSGPNRLIYVAAIATGNQPTISDTAGLTWLQRFTIQVTGGSAGYLTGWVAFTSSQITNDTITIAGSSTVVNVSSEVWAANGVPLYFPQSVVTATGTSGAPSVSSVQSGGILKGGYWLGTTANPTHGTGFIQIPTATYQLEEYETFTSPFSNVNIGIGTGSGTQNCGYGDVITIAPPALESSVELKAGAPSVTSPVFSTVGVNRLVYAVAIVTGTTAPTISDSVGLTWTPRFSIPVTGSTIGYMVGWYAIAPSQLTNNTVTITGAGTVASVSVEVWGKGGIAPSLLLAAVTASGTSGMPSVTTTQTLGVLKGGYWMSTTAAPTAGSGFTQIATGTYQLEEYEVFTSALSGAGLTIGTGNGTQNCGYAEVIV